MRNALEDGEIDDNELCEKISSILVSADYRSYHTTDTNTTYSTSHFVIHYYMASPSTVPTHILAVANHLESLRSQYYNWDFNLPILETSDNGKYHVFLEKQSDFLSQGGNAAAMTIPQSMHTNQTYSTYIVVFNYTPSNSSFDIDLIKDFLSHEYFHAIQYSYRFNYNWFTEACAHWSILAVGAQSDYINDIQFVPTFISNMKTTPMSSTTGYGAVLFPAAIHRNSGGPSVIRSIYEEFNNHTTFNESTLRTIITNGIANNGYTDDFVQSFRLMSSYLVKPQVWYNSLYSGASSWGSITLDDMATTDPSMQSVSLTSNSPNTFEGTTAYLTGQYYQLVLPSGFSGTALIDVSFFDSTNSLTNAGKLQVYTKDINHIHTVHYCSTSSGKSVFYQSGLGNDITDLYVIISNVAESGSISYTINITLYPLLSEMTISNSSTANQNSRYAERIIYLDKGEYADFLTTFSTNGSKMIQTLGTKATKIEIYNDAISTTTPLYSNVAGGHSVNAFLRKELQSGIQYRIRVSFTNSQANGYTKLVITPTTWLIKSGSSSISSFSDIWTVNSTNYSLNTSTTTNQVKVLVFTPPSTGSYTIATTGNIDTYLYVIDAQATDIIEQNIDYNDDGGSGNNAQLTKAFTAGKQYLIFYSAYNIFQNNSTYVGSTTLTIVKN